MSKICVYFDSFSDSHPPKKSYTSKNHQISNKSATLPAILTAIYLRNAVLPITTKCQTQFTSKNHHISKVCYFPQPEFTNNDMPTIELDNTIKCCIILVLAVSFVWCFLMLTTFVWIWFLDYFIFCILSHDVIYWLFLSYYWLVMHYLTGQLWPRRYARYI